MIHRGTNSADLTFKLEGVIPMLGKNIGVLPDYRLREVMLAKKWGINESHINPASVDLPLSDEGYRLEATFMPRHGETVRAFLEAPGVNPRRISFDQPLEVGVNYIIRIDAQIKLPEGVYGYGNPKSSTGRNNLLCRLIADGVRLYDALTPVGWSGEVWVLVRPDSYPVLLCPGETLSQLRLFTGNTILDRLGVELEFDKHPLLFSGSKPIQFQDTEVEEDGAILLTPNLKNPGWVCHNSSSVVDFSKRDNDKNNWYEPIKARNGTLSLKKGRFYILCTDEYVVVPPHLSAELRPIDIRFGEFRAHAAGYIDPGWGYGSNGRMKGQRITLEVIPFEDLEFRPGQVVSKLRYERMSSVPKEHYHSRSGSNYRGTRTVRLSKHFTLK